ncbi:YybS family protein [Bacillus dakarensis]|uniref:YybS family protein n=1 Tax=Robertmurraya dakarensis TaxID=1926278 RepID=UPI000981767B|nr:YybS family protein [Bacillus dakarensis]
MVNSPRRLTEGALLLAIFAVLLLVTIYVPVLGMVVNLFLSLPFIMFSAKNNRKSSVLFLIGAIAISLIVGTVLSIPLAIAYGLTGIVIGDFIREKKSRIAGFIGGGIAFLISLVGQYAVSVAFFKVDFIKESMMLMEESIEQSTEMMSALGQSPDQAMLEQFQASIAMLEVLIPSLFVMASFMIVFFIQLLSFPIIKRFGIEVPKWMPFRELKLPKSLLWYYLIVLFISLMLNPEEGSYWFTALMNLSFILQFFMLLQGLSFIYYLSHRKKLSTFIPVLATVLTLFIPIFLYIVRLLGIIDLGFDLRKRLEDRTKG